MTTSPKNIKTNDSTQTRVALLEQSIGHIAQTLLRIESRIDGLEKSLNTRIDKVENRLWQILFLISSSIVGMILGKIFHWL